MMLLFLFVLVVMLAGCKADIKLNDAMVDFKEFPEVDSLKFRPMSDVVLGDAHQMLYYDNNLLIKVAQVSNNPLLVNYSIPDDSIVSEGFPYGNGPDELLACQMIHIDKNLWIYDLSKRIVGYVSMDSIRAGKYHWDKHYKLPTFFYRLSLLNDSVVVGTNNYESSEKLSYVDLNTQRVDGRGRYAYLNDKIPGPTLIDAASCYVDVNPVTRDIVLSYRYTDVIEIYNKDGELKHSLHGPYSFNIDFFSRPDGSMGKTEKTRKAYVKSYVTENHIYLLYSGCKRMDENWSNGTELFVFSWDGKPLKRYLLNEPVNSFAINEADNKIYSYSLQTSELVEGRL